MPPRRGGDGINKRVQSRDNLIKTWQQQQSSTNDTQIIKNSSSSYANRSNFSIAPLILEGVKVHKLQLNDIKILNDFTTVLTDNGQSPAKIFVPRSIQKIKDTEKVAFVKRVDLKIPEKRIADSLEGNAFNVENVIRLASEEKNQPTQTIKITFNDPQNRNIFLQTGLQIDSMHFIAEPGRQK
ncbi:unnamed protein product, partial [Rotaria sp. Silwood1]